MPTDSLLLSIAICAVFLLFAAVLAVVDHKTTSWQRRASGEPAQPAADSTRKAA
jgi:hypothetical protein